MNIETLKFVAVVGPTASGKSDLAMALARQFDGEIICADSRTVYRGMDIGTAKPTVAERSAIPHHLLDVVEPGQKMGASQFKQLAMAALQDITARGKLPFLVGGSGLYIDAVLYDYTFPGEASLAERQELEQLTDEDLRVRLVETAPRAAEELDLHNRRRLIRALETAGEGRSKRQRQLSGVLSLGLTLNKNSMQLRIQKRIDLMLEKGFVGEVRALADRYGWDNEALSGVGYRAFRGVVDGTKTVQEAAADFARGDTLLVKKQLTWFKRNPDIHWLSDPAEAAALVSAWRERK